MFPADIWEYPIPKVGNFSFRFLGKTLDEIHLRCGILTGVFYFLPRCSYGKAGKMVASPYSGGAGAEHWICVHFLEGTLCGASGVGHFPVQRLRLDCHFGGSLSDEKVG